MLKKLITYTDYNGNERKEEHWFNLSQHEITKLQLSVKGGLIEKLKEAIQAEDSPVIMDAYEKLIDTSYGVRGTDGKSFRKTPEILEAFKCTPAYSALFMELLTNPKASDEFTRGVLPADLSAKLPADLNDAIPEDVKNILPSTN